MALPATSAPFSQWQFDHTQPDHRNSPHGQKRSVSDRDEHDLQNPINGFKRLRIHHAPLPQRPGRVSYRHASHEDHHEIDAYHGPQQEDNAHHSQATRTNDLQHIYEQTLNSQAPDCPAPPPQPYSDYRKHLSPQPIPNPPSRPTLIPTDFNRSYTSTPPPRPSQSNLADYMPLDNHPNTVIISDLDAEVAEIDAAEAAAKAQEQEEQQRAGGGYEFVLPEEVEKGMRGVPAHVLRGDLRAAKESSALVLYRPPAGLGAMGQEVEDGQTMKRRILEERRREKEQQQQGPSDDVDMGQGHDMAHEAIAGNSHAVEPERDAEEWLGSRGRRENTRWPLNIRNWAAGGILRPQQDDIQEEQEDDWDCDAMEIE